MKKLNLGFDIDEVIADIISPTLDIINKENNTNFIKKDVTDYSLKSVGITNPKTFFLEHYKLFDKAKPIYNARSILQKLKSDGHSIYLISSRDYKDDALERTIIWLNKLDISYNNIKCFARGKKGDIAKSFNLDFYIDDCIDEVLNVKEAGIKNVVVYDTPWNKKYNFRFIPRLYNWKEIYKYISDL